MKCASRETDGWSSLSLCWGYFGGQLPRLNFPSTNKRSSSTTESERVTTGTPEGKLHSPLQTWTMTALIWISRRVTSSHREGWIIIDHSVFLWHKTDVAASFSSSHKLFCWFIKYSHLGLITWNLKTSKLDLFWHLKELDGPVVVSAALQQDANLEQH